MKYKYHIISFLLLANLFMQAQSNTAIGINFGTITYQLYGVHSCQQFKDQQTDDLDFFYLHFHQQDYKIYKSFYYNDSCLASEEDFKSWIASVSKAVVTPLTRYLIHVQQDTFSIIGYSMSVGYEKRYFPLALYKKNNRWYLLDPQTGQQMLNLKMFLAFVNPFFIESFLQRPEEMKALYISSIFTAKGALNGDLLMNYYEARYDPSSPRFELSREVFHSVAENTSPETENANAKLSKLAKEYSIPADKEIILKNMCTEGNLNLALSKIAEWSNTFDVIEITDKFHKGMTNEGKNN